MRRRMIGKPEVQSNKNFRIYLHHIGTTFMIRALFNSSKAVRGKIRMIDIYLVVIFALVVCNIGPACI